MTQRPLGATGLSVAPLCLGAMNFGDPTDPDESARMIDRAIDGGITMIDVADVYAGGESEKIVGNALAANGKRDDIVLATKVGMPHGKGAPDQWHRREHIVSSCERSLASLQTDHIDLYQLHRPTFADVPQEETLAAFDELVKSGKVRHVGCSTHPAWMVMEALAISERDGLPRYETEQPPYNLVDRRIENELVPLCERYEIGLLPWSPLGGGILAFAWVFGMDRGWKEIHNGASIQIPPVFKFIMKYVAPVYLIIVFVGFTVQNLAASVRASWASTGSRVGMITIGATLLFLILVVRSGQARWRREGRDLNDTQPAD